MNEKFNRLPEVMKVTGLARSTVWLWVKMGKFPKPIKLSPRVTVWRESDLIDWIESQEQEIDTVGVA